VYLIFAFGGVAIQHKLGVIACLIFPVICRNCPGKFSWWKWAFNVFKCF